MYGVRLLRQNIEINVLGLTQEVKLKWWHGQVGAIPVFETKEQALDYADGNEDLIFKLEEKDK